MQKHLLYIPLIALSSALALTACSDEVTNTLTPDLPIGEKSPIELSVGGVDGGKQDVSTRATSVITDEVSTLEFSNFDLASKVFMVMKSEYVSLPSGFTDLNYGGTQEPKYCVTRGEVAANQEKIIFETGNERYWDDAHARSTKLSIWAFTAPGATYQNCTFGENDGIQGWKTTAISPVIKTWKVSKTGSGQTDDDFKTQNLCFSNNIVDYTSESKTDRRLEFKTPNKKFDGGKLVFYHAMSRITIHIKKGDGFTDADPFAFPSGTNVKLTNYNISGTFDIADGIFSSTTAGDIPWISSATKAQGDAFTLQALVIPGTTHSTESGSVWNKDNTNTSMSFTIDNNQYYITQHALLTALCNNSANNGIAEDATKIELEAGKHYIFTFTVGKTQIKNITAQVADWEEVIAEDTEASNARIKLNLEERGSNLTSTDSYSFYRAEKNNTGAINDDYTTYDWKTGYKGNVISPTYVAPSGIAPAHWTTSWFWENSLNFYHFRALAETDGTAKKAVTDNVVTDADNGDYLVLNHAESNYTDILWGAPMTDYAQNEVSDAANLKWNYGPTLYGFDGLDTKDTDAHQIYKAIGPTKDAIKLILFHMMSDVTFKIKTTTGDDKVNLGDGSTEKTTIKLEQIHTTGNLYMGNGLVRGNTADVANSNYQFTQTPAPLDGVITWPHYGAIPQSLENVVLVITTPDHNQYKVAMKDVLAESISNYNLANPYTEKVGPKYKINRWYPGFRYTYTFTLKKTGITDLQVTILDWETVEAENQDVVIQ